MERSSNSRCDLQGQISESNSNVLERLVGFLGIQIQDRLRTIQRLSGPTDGHSQVNRLAVRDGLPISWRLDVGADAGASGPSETIESTDGHSSDSSLEDYIHSQNHLKLVTAHKDLEELLKASKNTEEALARETKLALEESTDATGQPRNGQVDFQGNRQALIDYPGIEPVSSIQVEG